MKRRLAAAALSLILIGGVLMAAEFFSPDGGLGTVDVSISPHFERPDPPAAQRSSGGGGYGRGSYSSTSRMEYDGPDLADLLEPLKELFGVMFQAADAATKPLRDLVREIVEARRAERERRERMDAMVAQWQGLEAQRISGLQGRLAAGIPEWLEALPPRQKEAQGGACPAGAVAVAAAPEPPSGAPGHPAGIDPQKLEQLERCDGIEKDIDARCDGDGGCEIKEVRSQRYFELGCHKRWELLDGAHGPAPGVPNFATRNGGVWCVPQQAATPKVIANLLMRAADDEKADVEGEDAEHPSSDIKRPGPVKDPKLKNIIKALFHPEDGTPGGTAGAVRKEIETGQPTRGRWHLVKASEMATALDDVLTHDNLDPVDRATAEALKHDLLDALRNTKPGKAAQ